VLPCLTKGFLSTLFGKKLRRYSLLRL